MKIPFTNWKLVLFKNKRRKKDNSSARYMKLYNERKKKGICVQCGSPKLGIKSTGKKAAKCRRCMELERLARQKRELKLDKKK